MKTIALAISVTVVFLVLGLSLPVRAQDEGPEYYGPADQPPAEYLLGPEELDNLLAPIALYPDPLIAQILPAATFVDQIDQAARYVRQYGSYARVDDQPWDLSVRAVAHYPNVLYMMDDRYDWTVSLGQAYIEQPQDVMDAIQRLRGDAQAAGNLYSTPQQQVVVQPDYISIVPASPQYVYVPVYDPQLVYYEPYPYPVITFGVGIVIGAWLDRDCDWHRHRVYYHGWRGGGWIARSRPHIHDRRGIYINRSASVIRTNTRVLQHDTGAYRERLRTESVKRREGRMVRPPGRGPQQQPSRPEQRQPQVERQPSATGRHPAGGVERGPQQHPSRSEQRQPQVERQPGVTGGHPPASTEPGHRPTTTTTTPPTGGQHGSATGGRSTTDVFRGRDVQRVQPPSQSGYGGYGSRRDATIYRQRGQESRQQLRQPAARPAPVAPVPRPAQQFTPRPSAPVRAPAPTRNVSPPVSRPSAPAPMQRR